MYSLLIQFPLFSWLLDRLFHHYYVYVIHCGVVGNMQASHVCAPGSIPGNGTFLSTSIKLFKTQRRKKEKKEKKRKRKGKKREEEREKKREWMKTNKQKQKINENIEKHWKKIKHWKLLKIEIPYDLYVQLSWKFMTVKWLQLIFVWKRGGAVAARQAHNLQVDWSKLSSAAFFKVKKLWKQTKNKPNQNKTKQNKTRKFHRGGSLKHLVHFNYLKFSTCI